MGSALHNAGEEFAWSLLTELGAPGLARSHRGVAVDPEPVILLASLVMQSDARLRDQLVGWLAQHGKHLSVSRLSGLLKQSSQVLRERFSMVAVTVQAAGGPRLPTPVNAQPWARRPEGKPRRLPVERPALVRLRLRALSGVGARADVLAELLSRAGRWTRTVDLSGVGYSKRSIAAVLSELADAGLVERMAQGNAHQFRIRRPEQLSDVVADEGLRWLDQVAVVRFVDAVFGLDRLGGLPPLVRRVEAAKLRSGLASVAARLDLPSPPGVRGVEDAWEQLTVWGSASLTQLDVQSRDSNSEDIDQ
jgi:hypothetical protein